MKQIPAILADLPAREHDMRDEREGWRLAFNPRLVRTLDGETCVDVEPVLEAVTAPARHRASRHVGLVASVSRAFEQGLVVSLSATLKVRRHRGPDPLFRTRRVDQALRLSVRLLHRSLRYLGFSPYVGLSLERNRSIVPIHELRIHGLAAGTSRAF